LGQKPFTRPDALDCRGGDFGDVRPLVADAPNFERYDEKFDPVTGNGGLEI
jgi:hypothetical protein